MNNRSLSLRSQDMVALGVILYSPFVQQKDLSRISGLSSSEISLCIKRLTHAGLINSSDKLPNHSNCLEFFVHSVKYLYPPTFDGSGVGLKTSISFFEDKIKSNSTAPLIWPHFKGKESGIILNPINPCIPLIAFKNKDIHRLFALIDIIRSESARSSNYAIEQLEAELSNLAEEARKSSRQTFIKGITG